MGVLMLHWERPMLIKTVDGWKSIAPAIVSTLKDTPQDFSGMFRTTNNLTTPKLEAAFVQAREDHLDWMRGKGYQWN